MASQKTNAEKRILPPVYFLMAIVIMIVLHFGLPGYRWLAWPWKVIGTMPILVGLTIAVVAERQFKQQGTTVKPFQASSVLVSYGIFRHSRNPMYLGMVLVLVGVAISLGSVTPLAIPPIFIGLITSRFIVVEEKMLQDRFGQDYLDYKARVRRWF